MNKQNKEHFRFMQKRAMLYLPEDAVELKMEVKIYKDGAIKTVTAIVSNSEIQKAFQLAEDNYIDDDDVFSITEAGEEFLKELLETGAKEMNNGR